MRNVVKPTDLMIDSEWTFVHSSGKRTLYTYKSLIIAAGPNPKKGESGLDAMHSLLNPETGKCAQVSEKWLREGGGRWELLALARRQPVRGDGRGGMTREAQPSSSESRSRPCALEPRAVPSAHGEWTVPGPSSGGVARGASGRGRASGRVVEHADRGSAGGRTGLEARRLIERARAVAAAGPMATGRLAP